MTLDKFGRHIIKHNSINNNPIQEETVNYSNLIFSNHILSFDSDKIVENKYVLKSGIPCYIFPLEYAVIENVRINSDKIVLAINDKKISPDEISNFSLKLNDNISFILNDAETRNLSMFAEIIIKCPVKFEKYLVSSENAYYKRPL